uniref:hypothetical protein n=1 Tax=Paractinoplanes polyasparticus TaxID=2856853 RepID=UPI001C84D02A|nr:hypothetical protein [Actinoplanes polyasparticus]
MAEPTIDQAGLQAPRLLLERMGISPDDLVAGAPVRPEDPTFAEYVPLVAASISPGLLRAHGLADTTRPGDNTPRIMRATGAVSHTGPSDRAVPGWGRSKR